MTRQKKNLTPVTCNLCGGVRQQVLALSQTYRFIRCKECHLESVDPLPKQQELVTQYDGFFAGRAVQKEFNIYVGLAESSLRHHLYCLSAFGARTGKGGSFLDIGFGGGHYLGAAERLGLIPHGVELDHAAFQRAKELGFGNIYNCRADQLPFPRDSFDIVKAMHVLEHTTDPLGVLRSMFALTKPGGWAIVDVPNQASKIARLKILLRGLGMKREEYGYLQPPVHLYAFTPQTLKAMIEKAGFAVVRTIFTSPIEQRYFPTTPRYFGSTRGQTLKTLYHIVGSGSYLCVYARKDGRDGPC